MTTPTMPTDTEMLDWLEKNNRVIFGESPFFWFSIEGKKASKNYKTIRAAISAAMAMEAT